MTNYTYAKFGNEYHILADGKFFARAKNKKCAISNAKALNEVEKDITIHSKIQSKWPGMSEEDFDDKTDKMYDILNDCITDVLESLVKSNKKSTKNNEK